MERDITICFQTTSELSKALEKIAKEECRSIASVVESIIYHYLNDNRKFKGIHQNRRRLERKKVCLPAFIGDSHWQRREFEKGTILDVSFGGMRISVPKGTKIEIQRDGAPKEIRVIFSLAECPWPINLKCHLRRISESEDEVLFGTTFVDHDFYTYTTLQKYLI